MFAQLPVTFQLLLRVLCNTDSGSFLFGVLEPLVLCVLEVEEPDTHARGLLWGREDLLIPSPA